MILNMQQLARIGLILAGICLGRLFPAMAQDTLQEKKDTTRVIHIISSDSLNVITKDGVSLNRFINNVIFRQANTLFYSDSAFINKATNVLDAYGHIHINQADSIHIYGDYLHYEGETRLATLRQNARLTDGKVTISGPELQYDMNARIGTYVTGGKLVNGSSVLTSQEGFYYADTKDVYFKRNVLLVDPEYTLTTDTLLYNTTTKIATLVAPTTINDGKTIMYATSGEYNTETGQGNFDSRPTIEDSSATITADRIIMDKKTGMAYAYGNMIYRDTAQKMSLISNFGTVNQAKKTLLATQHPLLVMERQHDTLFLAADTLFSGILNRDSIALERHKEDSILKVKQQEKLRARQIADSLSALAADTAKANILSDTSATQPKKDSVLSPTDKFKESLQKANGPGDPDRDSLLAVADTATLANTNPALPKAVRDSLVKAGPDALQNKPDTTIAKDTTEYRFIRAWHHVKIYSDSLQGVADSVFYSSQDSIFRFYGKKQPVLWANDVQLSGDTIHMYIKNQTMDRLYMTQNALIVKEVAKGLYDQIKGNFITSYFKDQSLDWMHVDGNAESIYYIQDNDSAIISVNKTLSGVINIYFKAGQLDHVNFIKDPEGTMYPFGQRPIEQMQLENFHWDIDRKPKSKAELIGNANEKEKEAAPIPVETEEPEPETDTTIKTP